MIYLYYDFGNKEIEIAVDCSEIQETVHRALSEMSKNEVIDLFLDYVDEDNMFDLIYDDLYERNESIARELSED